MKLQTGDIVKIVRGKDSGRTGKIEKVFPKEDKVVVEGVNQYKRHIKGQMAGQKSEIITLTKPLPVANVMLQCPKCKKPARIGYKILKDGNKTRVCKNCSAEIS